jgi:hypothetical protein
MFHSTKVSTSLPSPSNLTYTYYTGYVCNLDQHFVMPPCFTSKVHTKSTFEKKDPIELWCHGCQHHKVHSWLVINLYLTFSLVSIHF